LWPTATISLHNGEKNIILEPNFWKRIQMRQHYEPRLEDTFSNNLAVDTIIKFVGVSIKPLWSGGFVIVVQNMEMETTS
jgi:hypothetical protein